MSKNHLFSSSKRENSTYVLLSFYAFITPSSKNISYKKLSYLLLLPSRWDLKQSPETPGDGTILHNKQN